MSVHEPTPFRAAIPSVDADRAVKFGVGVAAAPLWATFFTAASAGMAYWWMTAWSRRELKSFAPVPARTVEPAPRRPELVVAPARASEPALAVAAPPAPAPAPEPESVVEGRSAPHAPKAEIVAGVAPVAAGLELAVEPTQIAAAVEVAKPAHAASGGDGVKAESPAAAQRKASVRRKPERKA